MNRSPAFRFYADDFLAGTITMTHEERGLYILALCIQWGQGSISEDDLPRLAPDMSPASITRVRIKFDAGEDGRLRQHRLEEVRRQQEEYREHQSAKGKASAQARFNRGSTVVQPDFNRKATEGSTEGSTEGQPSASASASASASSTASDSQLLSGKPDEGEVVEGVEKQKGKKYHADARAVLHLLNESSRKHFRETDANLSIISDRLRETGVDLDGVRLMLSRQAKRWLGTEQAEYLRPETLFGKKKFDGYYAARELPIQSASARRLPEQNQLQEKIIIREFPSASEPKRISPYEQEYVKKS